jgi:transcriptional regulator with XRE-family HTH domain
MSDQDGNPHMGLEIGRTLRLAREKRGISLQQVEEATKIRARYLRDLENENFEVLPAVFMLGSLKTYAEHLGLDGAAMTGELKRRQSSLQPEQDQAAEVPPSREPRGLLASLSHLVGISGTVEDEAGTMAPVHSPGLYVSLVVVLMFVLATYLASSIRGEDRPSISVVQEPTVSQLPSGVGLVGNVEDEDRNTEDPNKEVQPESPAIDDIVEAEQSGQEKYAPRTAQMPSSATAVASASASASSGSVSAPATASPAPTNVRLERAAREKPGSGGMAAPTGTPVRASGSQRLQEGPVDATRFGNGVPNTVEKAVNSVR